MPDITYDVGRVSFVMKGAWNLATNYEKLDAVTNDGSLYIAKQDVPGGTAITTTTYWQLAAEKGDQGPTGGVDSVNGRTGAVTGLAEEEALGGTLRQLLAVSKSIDFNNTAWAELGTLNWSRLNTTAGHWRFVASLNGIKQSAAPSSVPNIICSKYKAGSPNDTWSSITCITVNNATAQILACDESYSTAAAFKAALKGVLLAYEKE